MPMLFEDVQLRAPWGYCTDCGGELYTPPRGDVPLCALCREERAEEAMRAEGRVQALEEMDAELRHWLADEVRDVIWNRLTARLRLGEERCAR